MAVRLDRMQIRELGEDSNEKKDANAITGWKQNM